MTYHQAMVNTCPKRGNCTGRNGHFPLHAVSLTLWGENVSLDFYGKRGRSLNAGAHLYAEEMDALCLQWCHLRNLSRSVFAVWGAENYLCGVFASDKDAEAYIEATVAEQVECLEDEEERRLLRAEYSIEPLEIDAGLTSLTERISLPEGAGSAPPRAAEPEGGTG